MKEYHKIESIFKRYEKGHEYAFKFIEGEYRLPEFEYLKDVIWTWDEKIDGTNIRLIAEPGAKDIRYGGKTERAQIPTFLLSKLQELISVEKMREVFSEDGTEEEPMTICLYGEGMGKKIQKGGGNYIPDGVDFALFDVKVGDWWLKREDVEDVAEKLGLTLAPIVGEGTLMEAMELAKSGFSSVWHLGSDKEFRAEGLVLRPKVQLFNRQGRRIITKMKYKDFIVLKE